MRFTCQRWGALVCIDDLQVFCKNYSYPWNTNPRPIQGRAIGVIAPPKTYESNFFHHDFVQFGKTPECELRRDCQKFLKSLPLNLRAGSAPVLTTGDFHPDRSGGHVVPK